MTDPNGPGSPGVDEPATGHPGAGGGAPVRSGVLVLVPAYNEAERVGATVGALHELPGVAEVLVVSDGSTDATAARALDAGAHCLELPSNFGKGDALNAGLSALMERVADGVTPEPGALLLADADLQDTAARLDVLLRPVLLGEADMAVADLPAQQRAGLKVIEVEVDLRHAATGRDLTGVVHRGRQAGAIARELGRRRVWRGRDGGGGA